MYKAIISNVPFYWNGDGIEDGMVVFHIGLTCPVMKIDLNLGLTCLVVTDI